MHPLAPNFSDMSDADLNENIKKLQTRLSHAYRTSSSVVPQIQMLLQDYTEERGRRDKQSLDKLMQKSKDSGNDWDDIIDIG